MDQLRALLDKVNGVLQGEPLRAIGYGAAIVVVGVVAGANALGITRFGANISFADALVLATSASTALIGIVEGARRYVFSPASVAQIVAAQVTPAADGVIAPDAEEGPAV